MERARVDSLRTAVLHLHKVLVDVEREAAERLEGRLTPHQFLERLMHDEAYAWLKSMSAIIVGLDEWLEDDAATADAARAYADELRRLTSPDPAGDHFQRRYGELLQASPAVILAHADLLRALDNA